MDKKQRIAEIIKSETSNADGLRWAVWLCWEEFGDVFMEGKPPTTMTSTEFADVAETLGVKRNTAMNRYSEARRNWIGPK